MKITDLSVNRPVTAAVLYIALIVLGVFSLGKLAIDLIPNIQFPMVVAVSTYPGASPEEVEENLTRTVENAAASVARVEKVTSTSSEGQSMVMAEFAWGTDMGVAAEDMRAALDRVRDFIPDDASQPTLFKFDPSMIPVMMVTIEGKRDLRSLRYLADNEIRTQLEQTDGVAAVQVFGGEEREIQVELDRTALASYDLSIDQVVGALRLASTNITGGNVKEGSLVYSLRTLGRFNSLADIRKTIVSSKGGIPVYLEDVARVRDGVKEQNIRMQQGAEQAVIASIQKQSGTNTVQVARQVRQQLERLNKSLPADVRIKPFYSTADFIEKSISSVAQSALLGGALAIFILLLFLKNIPITLIIGVSIPLSVVITFIFMYFFNLTLNLMSLGGLALGIGMLVDNSIVVLENIFRYREYGTKPVEAARLGTAEMAMPVAASTLTTVVVFLPLVLFIRGLASELFKDMAFTVTFSLMASLLVALTVIPMLSSRVKKFKVRQKLNPLKDVENELRARGPVMRAMDSAYGAVLGLAVRHRAATIGLIVAFFLSSLMLIPKMGIEFMPQSDEGQVELVVQTPVGSNLEATRRAVDQVYGIVQRSVPEVESTLVQIGRSGGGGFGSESQNTGSVWMFLKDKKERTRSTQQVMEALRGPVARIPGATVRMSAQSGAMGGGGGGNLTVSVKGYDLTAGQELAGHIKGILEKQPNIRDVRISREEGLPEYRIRVDRERAAQYGLNAAQVGTTIKRAFAGESVAKAVLGGEEVNVSARLREKDRLGPGDLERISVATPLGVMVPLANLVTLQRAFGPKEIQREAQQRVVRVDAAVQGGDMGRTVAGIRQEVNKLTIPPGFTVLYGGAYENLQKTIRDLSLVLLLSIVLVYLVMAAQFESFMDPFIIMFTMPMTFSGVIWIHLLTGITFNAISGIGVLVLMGVVVNNGIILVDYTNLLRKRGYAILDAVQLAGRSRLRPILMTVLTTILGLIPLAITSGSSAEMEMPMARTIIGGLTVSTLFTLFLIPALYTVFEVRKERRRARRAERHQAREAKRQVRSAAAAAANVAAASAAGEVERG